jgi:hypothetical protein
MVVEPHRSTVADLSVEVGDALEPALSLGRIVEIEDPLNAVRVGGLGPRDPSGSCLSG